MLLLIMLSFTACSQTKKMTDSGNIAQNNSDSYIILGQGGGFTGRYEFYEVRRTGVVNQIIDNSDTIFYSQLGEDVTNSIFEQLSSLSLNDFQNSAPGNMNYSLKIYQRGETHAVNWSDNNNPKDDILKFYQFVYTKIKVSKQ